MQFGADAYTVSEGNTATITVTLSADPQSTVVISLVTTDQGGAVPADYSVPSSVTFNTGEMSKTFDFTAMADDASDTGESVMIGFGTTLPEGVSAGTTNRATVTITDEGCQDGDIWCATATFDAEVQWEGRYDLHAGEVDRREFSYNGEDYRFWSIPMDQNRS